MAGDSGEMNKNIEAVESHVSDKQHGEAHLAKMHQEVYPGQQESKQVEKVKTSDSVKETTEQSFYSPERAMLALERLSKAMSNPEQSGHLTNLLKSSDGVFERVLLAGLNPTDDPAGKQRQQDILAMLTNAFNDSTRKS